MTKNQGLKRAVRQYLADHPEMSYTQALRFIRREREFFASPDERRREPDLRCEEGSP
jgi:hypothetical protein